MTHTFTEQELSAHDEQVRAAERERAWDEGFDAGERDVFEHERKEWPDGDKCIPNPYRTTPAEQKESN